MLGASASNRRPDLSLPGSRSPALCHRGRVLGEMRDRSGGPNLLVRALALLLALVLAGPLTVAVVRAAARAIGLAL